MVIDELLANHYHPRTMEELMRAVNKRLQELGAPEVGIRCIQKDIKFLQEESPWLVDIQRVPIANSDASFRNHTSYALRYEDPAFSIFKKQLTDEEKYLLGEVMRLLGQFDGLPQFDGLDNLKKSLEITSPKQIIALEKNPLEDKSYLGELFTAISKQWTLRLFYHTYAAPQEVKSIIFFPYLIKEYNRRWYVIGAAESDGKILNFAFDRIDKVVPVEHIPYKPYEGNLVDRFADIIGVTFDEHKDAQRILFWVNNASKGYVISKPIHESQITIHKDEELRNKYPQLKEGAFFSIDVQENYELIRELSSFGAALVVLSPLTLQKKITQRIAEMQDAYRCMQ